MLEEFRELMSSAEWIPVTVGHAILHFLESRRNHSYQARMQAQRISRLESVLDSRAVHDRGTDIRLNEMVGELASLSVRCHEGPNGDTQALEEENRMGKEGNERFQEKRKEKGGNRKVLKASVGYFFPGELSATFFSNNFL